MLVRTYEGEHERADDAAKLQGQLWSKYVLLAALPPFRTDVVSSPVDTPSGLRWKDKEDTRTGVHRVQYQGVYDRISPVW